MINVVKNFPTTNGIDGSIVSYASSCSNPVIAGPLDISQNEESSPIKLALRADDGYHATGIVTLSITGTTASYWAFAPDNGGTAGTWQAYGSSITFPYLATPSPTATATATGGSLASGTHSYRMTALNEIGETMPSTAVAVAVTGATSQITLTWSAVSTATSYAIYGRTSGSEQLLATASAGATTWTDTGSGTPSGALPTASTAQICDRNRIIWAKAKCDSSESSTDDKTVKLNVNCAGSDWAFETVRKRAEPVANCISLTLNLQSATLSDTFDLQLNESVSLDKRWVSSLYGWDWSAKALKISRFVSSAGKLDRWNVTAGYDVEDILRKAINFPTSLTSASDIMGHVANQLGKTANFYFTDFTIAAVTDKPTVRDICSRLFSWSTQVPSMLINVFIRNDELWVVQRGQEPSTYAIDKTVNGEATVDQEHLYTLHSETDSNGTDKKGAIPLDWDTATQYISGSYSGPGGSSIQISSGLLTQETLVTDTEETSTSYSYSAGMPPAAMTSRYTTITGPDYTKTIDTSWSFSNTTASLGALSSETSTTITTKNGNTTTSIQETYYSPAGQNFYSVAVFVDGVLKSSQVCTGRPPGNQASVYTSNDSRIARPEVETSAELASEYSLPFTSTGTIASVVAEIERLNGLTQETVTLPIWDAHVLDFSEKYTWDGNTYYLDANRIEQVPTRITQNVNLVRWF